MSVEAEHTLAPTHPAPLEQRPEVSASFARLLERRLEETRRFYGDRLITLAVYLRRRPVVLGFEAGLQVWRCD